MLERLKETNGVRLGALVISCATTAWLGVVSPASALFRVPIKVESCSLQTFGSNAPAGLTFNSDNGSFVVTDENDAVAYVIDGDCVAQATFSTGAFGANNPQGISYNAAGDLYVIVDSTTVRAYFANAIGLFQGDCNLAAVGAIRPRGVAYNTLTDTFAIIDDRVTDDQVLIIDDTEQGGGACNLLGQFSIAGFSTEPQSIAYIPGDDQYSIVDSADDEVYIVDNSFVQVDQFDTLAGFGSGASKGVFFLPTDQRHYFVDSMSDSLVTVDARGTLETLCSTADFLADSPTAVTFNSDDQEIVFADDALDQIFILDVTDCGLVRQFDVAALGIADVSGVTYLSDTNQLAIADQANDGVYFVGYDSQLLESECDTTDLGLTGLRGVSGMAELDRIVVTDLKTRAIAQLDLACNPVAQRSSGYLGVELNSSNPGGVAFQPALGRFLIADSGADEVFVSNYEGFAELQFDLQGLGLTNVTGLSAFGGGNGYMLVDSDADIIARLTLPLLVEPQALSGRFTTTSGIPVLLYEREEGRFTGTVQLPGSDLPLFGQFDRASLTITFVVETAGGPRVFTGSVAPDLNGMSLPNPVGILSRSF